MMLRLFAAIGIAGFLIFSLVGDGNNRDVIENIQSRII